MKLSKLILLLLFIFSSVRYSFAASNKLIKEGTMISCPEVMEDSTNATDYKDTGSNIISENFKIKDIDQNGDYEGQGVVYKFNNNKLYVYKKKDSTLRIVYLTHNSKKGIVLSDGINVDIDSLSSRVYPLGKVYPFKKTYIYYPNSKSYLYYINLSTGSVRCLGKDYEMPKLIYSDSMPDDKITIFKTVRGNISEYLLDLITGKKAKLDVSNASALLIYNNYLYYECPNSSQQGTSVFRAKINWNNTCISQLVCTNYSYISKMQPFLNNSYFVYNTGNLNDFKIINCSNGKVLLQNNFNCNWVFDAKNQKLYYAYDSYNKNTGKSILFLNSYDFLTSTDKSLCYSDSTWGDIDGMDADMSLNDNTISMTTTSTYSMRAIEVPYYYIVDLRNPQIIQAPRKSDK